MTLFSLMIVFCTALSVVLIVPSTVSAATPDYLSWERTEAKAGDLLANRYVLFDKSKFNDWLKFDFEGSPYGSASARDYGEIRFSHVEDTANRYILYSYENENDSSVILMPELYQDDTYAVFKITPYTTNFDEGTIGVKPLTLTSTLSDPYEQGFDGMYFITDNGATLPDDGSTGGTEDTDDTLSEFIGTNYNGSYLTAGTKFDNFLLCIHEGVTGVINFETEGANIYILADGKIKYTNGTVSEEIDAFAISNRYGVKAYVYDVGGLPSNLTVKSLAGTVSGSAYSLISKDSAAPENPDNGNDTENPGTAYPGIVTDEGDFWDKARDFFENLSTKISENTGVVVGSTGALILVAIVLYIIFKR